MLHRRRFLELSTLAASAGAAGCAHSRPLAQAQPAPAPTGTPARLGDGAPRRIIHVVADGMSQGTLSCADQLSRHERGRPLTWIDLLNRPDTRTALMDMRSLDSIVTDSAAASSSWGCGRRVRNGTLNVSSKGRPLLPLMHLFGQAGWKRGLVTTTEITHATPAGFTVCVDSRSDGPEIASHYLTRRLDLLLGGGQEHFDAAKRKDKRNLFAEFQWEGYYVAKTRDEILRAPMDQPWLGTLSASHLPYTLDRRSDPKIEKAVPTLAELVDLALGKLGRHENFLLQVEGGRVDHGAHNNDAAAALREMIALDEAIDRIVEFQRIHPETLVLMTTDHGTANLGLNGMGDNYRDSSKRFRSLAGIKASFPVILKRLKDAKSETQSAAILTELTGYKIDAKKLTQFLPFVAGKGAPLFDGLKSDTSGLGQLLANHTGISFTSGSHTSDYVPVVSFGPGSQRFRGLLRNTDLFEAYTDFASIDYRNPDEPQLAEGRLTPGPSEDTARYAMA
jgi:alkaline phosphatase